MNVIEREADKLLIEIVVPVAGVMSRTGSLPAGGNDGGNCSLRGAPPPQEWLQAMICEDGSIPTPASNYHFSLSAARCKSVQ